MSTVKTINVQHPSATSPNIVVDSSGNSDIKGTLKISGATSGAVSLVAPAAAGSATYTLPSADGAASNVLTTDGSGTLSWAPTVASAVAGNGITVSGATGDVTISQNIYTGTAGNNTNYPIGTVLLGSLTSLQATTNLATSRTLYASNTAAAAITDTGGTGRTALSGTWRARGSYTIYDPGTTQYITLFQRTA